MALGTDDLKTAGCKCFLIKLNIGTTSRHVGSDGNVSVNTGLSNDLSFSFMELRIQDFMLDSCLIEHPAEFLGCIDVNGTDQDGLPLCMSFLSCLKDGIELLSFGLINRILKVFSDNGFIGGNGDDIHSVDFPELCFLGESGTGHAGLFLEEVKEVLECDGSKSLGLTLNLNMLFGFDGLMETVGESSSGHDTSGKFVYDKNLIILDNIILIFVHEVMRSESKDDIVVDLGILGIRKILDMEELLYSGGSGFGEVNDLILLVNYKVSGLFLGNTHDGIHLGKLFDIVSPFELSCKEITHLIECGGFAALTGYDKRSSGFVDQNGVNLVDDTEVKVP